MQRPNNLKVGDKFRVIRGNRAWDIISLKQDDGSDYLYFWNEDKSDYHYMYFSNLEPYTKTIRDAQVGDVVVRRDGVEHMVLERGQSTVLLSYGSDFKEADVNYHFDELEKDFTLKDEPEVVDKTAEAMKLLKEAGYKINKE